jgi:hypothetical protein
MSLAPPSQVGDASRVVLARLALDVVSTIPGVVGTDAGPGGLYVTADPPFGILRGVSVIAQSEGGYELDLCLVARMVPLLPLGEEIRRRLRARAAREGLADQLGTVNVEFARALSGGETMIEVSGAEVTVGAEAVEVSVSAGSQTSVPPIPAAAPSAFPAEPPASDKPLPPLPAPPPSTQSPPPAPSGPSAVPKEPTGWIGSETTSPDPAHSPVPPRGSTARTPPPDRESRS